MKRTFEEKQPIFEEAADYLDLHTDILSVVNRPDDPLIVFYFNDTREEGAEAQLDRLLDVAGLERVWRGQEVRLSNDAIFFEYASEMRGVGPDSTEKGFAYLPSPPQPSDLMDSLESVPREAPYPLYKPLKDNWYLYIWYVD